MKRFVVLTTLIFLLPSLASAAIAFDAQSSVAAGASPRSLTHTSVDGTAVILAATDSTSVTDTVTGCTVNGAAMTKIKTAANVAAGDAYFISTWKFLSPTTTTNLIVCTASAGTLGIEAHSYTGAADVEASASATDQTSPYTQSVVTVTDNDWTVFFTSGRGSTPAASTGATTRVNGVPGGAASFDSNGALTPPGTKSEIVTSTNTMNGVLLALTPTGAAAAAPFVSGAAWWFAAW